VSGGRTGQALAIGMLALGLAACTESAGPVEPGAGAPATASAVVAATGAAVTAEPPAATRAGPTVAPGSRRPDRPPTATGITREQADVYYPPAPRDLVATVTARGVRLSWEPGDVPAGAKYDPALAGYRVYRATTPTDFAIVAEPPGTGWLDTKVRPGMTYWYTVTAVYGKGHEGRRPDPIQVDVPR
jgi:hypothetical protein